MKVGIFNPYFETMGGGERYTLTVAQYFQNRGDQVDIFWDHRQDKEKLTQTFSLDLSQVQFVPDVFFDHKSFWEKIATTAKYDLMFFLSDGSIPSSLARKNILHFQRPFCLAGQINLLNKIKLSHFSAVVCNSKFTKKDIDKTFGIDSLVLYPPVDLASFSPGKKEKIILSVGRFFGPSHPKKQEVLVDSFIKMNPSGWQLILIGGMTKGADINLLQKKAVGHPIKIIPDSSFGNLVSYYSRATIYWHAAGFGENLETHPEKAEHFGMSTVEAMAAGCVPIVFAGGGQLEIITENTNGYFWKSIPQLIKKTTQVIKSLELVQKISYQATIRAQFFSKEKFFQKLHEIT